MPDALRIALAQLNQTVGDVSGNADAILAARREARDSDLVVFPELHLIGYPPEDLVLKPALIERATAQLETLALASASDGPAMLVGSAFIRDGALHNGVALLDQGRITAVRFKHELPNYGVFDEKRLFLPGPLPEPVILRGTMIGVPICEDIWRPEVCRHLADFGAEIFVCINGSPYEINKDALRIDGVAKLRAGDTGIPLAYLNRVGGQDELAFDGGSFVVNRDGALAAQARDWEEQVLQTEWTRTAQGWRCDRGLVAQHAGFLEGVYCALVLALRDFAERNAFCGIVLNLCGDGAALLCAALAIDAVGAERVQVMAFDSGVSDVDEAREQAQGLGLTLQEHTLGSALAGLPGQSETFAMGLAATVLNEAARVGEALLLSNVTKSDLSLAFALPPVALLGHFAPLKDVNDVLVQALIAWRTDNPARIGIGPDGFALTCPQQASRFGAAHGKGATQARDAMLFGLVEHDKSVDQLVAEGFDRTALRDLEARLHRSELRRRMAPPGVKLTRSSFGRDRRFPITHAFRTGS